MIALASRAMRSIPPGLVEAVWIVAALRVAWTLFAAYVVEERPMPPPCHFEEAHNGWTFMPPVYRTGLELKLVGIWERWDACWYAKIAAFGYVPDARADETAFFPLLPALMRLLAPLVASNVVAAGIVVSTVALAIALWGIHELVSRDLGDAVARRTVLYVAVFPTAFFFFAPYTESLFLALAVWSIVLARRGAWGWAASLAVFVGLTRPVGALLVLPLAWLALAQARAGGRSALPWLGAAAPVLGLAAFTAYSLRITGETPLDAQRRWWGSPELHQPWELVQASLDWIGRTGSGLQALDLAVLLGAIGLFVVGLRALPVEYSLYAAPHVFLASTRILPTPLTSTTRYLMLAFPLLVVVAMLGERRRVHVTWLIASVLFLALLAHAYLRGDFVAIEQVMWRAVAMAAGRAGAASGY